MARASEKSALILLLWRRLRLSYARMVLLSVLTAAERMRARVRRDGMGDNSGYGEKGVEAGRGYLLPGMWRSADYLLPRVVVCLLSWMERESVQELCAKEC